MWGLIISNLSRRNFLKLTSGLVGGAILSTGLSGCIDSGTTETPFPNGYRFYRVKSGGETVGTDNRSLQLDLFRGSVHISDNNIITFDGANSDNRVGIVQIAMDFDSAAPKIEWEKVIAMTDEYLDDGRYVGNFNAMDVNRDGNVAVAVTAKTPSGANISHTGSGLYLQTNNESFQPVFLPGQKFASGSILSTGQLGDIDLHEDNEILVVSHLKYPGDSSANGYGIIHLPEASVEYSQLLMATGDFVPYSNHAMEMFGLIDMHDNGHYAVGGHATALSSSNSIEETANNALIIKGNTATSENLLLGADAAIGNADLTAPCFYAPRTTSVGDVYGITWDPEKEHMSLHLGSKKIIATGDKSPLSNNTLYMSTGSVSSDDSLFYSITGYDRTGYTTQELVHYDGYNHSVLLCNGDTLSDGGAPVETIYFGGTTLQADSNNRIVFYCTFTDGTKSLVVGIPA